ncbi:unnamed protein product [Brachionus calyciflorus]|uniref:Cathepsin L n=1 Tax=Brachionus calyciflorus TaxID=104777 RepID=A0A813T8H1_9BILA|nr:unnamed protein product [Brachionus calyciflorus]
MRGLVFLFAVVCTASALDASLNAYWTSFKNVHQKTYETSAEELYRRQIWENNLQFIRQHNQEAQLGHHTFTVAMNKFGDLTGQEFGSLYNGFNMSSALNRKLGQRFVTKNNDVPDTVDWRTQGYVTPVKDQGQCGSCWAFSAVAALEGQHFKQAGELVSLSEQNLVDCSGKFGNQGCNGGLMDQAFDYIKSNKGIDTEESYPYTARDGKCKFNPATVGATDTGYVDIPTGNEKALTEALATVGPISVAIDASRSSFQFYSKGVYSDKGCSSTRLDHGVTAVGYDSLGAGQDYYIVKNSWGTGWGNKGFIWMARNQKNMCGIATMASYPLV